MTYKLLFVCLGNICRSPSAENIMRHLLTKAGAEDQVFCDSAGTSAYHIGSAPDGRMAAAALKEGIVLTGTARQFTPQDFEDFDLILAMDRVGVHRQTTMHSMERDNYHNSLRLDRSNAYGHKVKLMLEFCRNYPDEEVPDPYYGGSSGFDYVIAILLDACEGLFLSLQTEGIVRV